MRRRWAGGGDGDLERTERGEEEDGAIERSDRGDDGSDDACGVARIVPSIMYDRRRGEDQVEGEDVGVDGPGWQEPEEETRDLGIRL